MLAADKLLLQSQIKQNAVQLREKELKLHYDNFNAVGTQVRPPRRPPLPLRRL